VTESKSQFSWSMMASQVEQTNPLIAALPPETDYITYLTLLEYQLTPSNLQILTRLLTGDDGTLAKEIGWDLLKLVLPLSEEVPEEAGKCLEVVARRGNPREVLVKLAEELENLGQEQGGGSSGTDQEVEEDEGEGEMRTFPGEAEPIHLGTMKLEGMPPPFTQRSNEPIFDPNDGENVRQSDVDKANSIKFQMLLSMLRIIHPRIQSPHPSRFLATSLPAALRSYRRLAIDSATTSAFLSLLGKLSGKQRPALPPRTSTADAARVALNAGTSAETQLAPLPDPEAQHEATGPDTLSAEEAVIIRRLLQAVLLEVFEEYINSLATQEPPSMSWTARLRESREPEKIVPRRQTETEKWRNDLALQERDTLIAKFVDLTDDLGMDLETACKQTPSSEADNPESASEYPTSPEQIPFPKIGAFLLFIAHYFVSDLAVPWVHRNSTTGRQRSLELPSFITCIEDPDNRPELLSQSTPVLDFLIAIIYAAAQGDEIHATLPIWLFLTDLCSENPDPYIRDSAHATATIIFHQCPSEKKLALVKHILKESQNTSLRAVAVDWLKDDIAKRGTSSLHSDILTTDAELGDALCAAPHIDDLVVQLPFRVAVLNLLTVAPTEQGDWLIHALTRLRRDFSDDEAEQHGISTLDLWSFDDALQRATDAFAKQDPAARPEWTRKEEWLNST
jgi:hypothetical protein